MHPCTLAVPVVLELSTAVLQAHGPSAAPGQSDCFASAEYVTCALCLSQYSTHYLEPMSQVIACIILTHCAFAPFLHSLRCLRAVSVVLKLPTAVLQAHGPTAHHVPCVCHLPSQRLHHAHISQLCLPFSSFSPIYSRSTCSIRAACFNSASLWAHCSSCTKRSFCVCRVCDLHLKPVLLAMFDQMDRSHSPSSK